MSKWSKIEFLLNPIWSRWWLFFSSCPGLILLHHLIFLILLRIACDPLSPWKWLFKVSYRSVFFLLWVVTILILCIMFSTFMYTCLMYDAHSLYIYTSSLNNSFLNSVFSSKIFNMPWYSLLPLFQACRKFNMLSFIYFFFSEIISFSGDAKFVFNVFHFDFPVASILYLLIALSANISWHFFDIERLEDPLFFFNICNFSSEVA